MDRMMKNRPCTKKEGMAGSLSLLWYDSCENISLSGRRVQIREQRAAGLYLPCPLSLSRRPCGLRIESLLISND